MKKRFLLLSLVFVFLFASFTGTGKIAAEENVNAEKDDAGEITGSSLTLKKEKLVIGKGDTVYLNTCVESNIYQDDRLTYTVSDKKLVKVTEHGGVYGKKRGTCTVTVTDPDGNSVQVAVVVKYAPKKISIDKDSIKMNVGKIRNLHASVNKKTAASLYYSSSDTSVARVYANGNIKAVSPGTCTITVRTYNNVVTECAVTVREPVKSVEYSFDRSKMPIGSKRKITAKFYPEGSYEKLIWTSSDEKIATVNQNGRVKMVGEGTVTISAYCETTGQTKNFKFKGYYAKQIAFTFDDGPSAYTKQVLDALKPYGNAHVTFFIVGQYVSSHTEEIKRMYNEGHELGNHSWSHPQLNTLSLADQKSQINKTAKAIKKACGHKPTLLRPPYGSYNQSTRDAAGTPMVTWSVDTKDWKYRDADYVCKTILEQAKDGAVVLLHDLHKTSVEGFIKALPKLIDQGYELVTVTEILTRDGSRLKNGSVYYKGAALK